MAFLITCPVIADDQGPGTLNGRSCFYDFESIPLFDPVSGVNPPEIQSPSGRRTPLKTEAGLDGYHLTLSPNTLSPGKWIYKNGARSFPFEVVSSIRNTPFTICNYQANPNTLDRALRWQADYGFNTYMLQKASFYEMLCVDPTLVDRCVKAQARWSSVYTLAATHQPVDIRNDWSEPAVINSLRYRTRQAAQFGRFLGGGFIGLHYADEPGLTWGCDNGQGDLRSMHPDEPFTAGPGGYIGPLAVPSQRLTYTSQTGKATPNWRKPGENMPAWLDWMRWRTTLLGSAFSQFTRDIHAVDPTLIGYSQLYSWKWIQDGNYMPDTGKGVDVLSTHGYNLYHFGLWYQAGEVDAMRSGAWDKPLWMLAPWQGITPDNAIRAVVYSSLARKVEGLTWPLDWADTWPQAKEISDKILPLSAVLGTLKKQRDAVGLFHSRDQHLVDFAREVDITQAGLIYPGKLSTAWLTAMACGYPSSWVVEEELLDKKAFVHKVILCPGLTTLRPELKAAFEAYISGGGCVMLDAGSTADIKGARKLPFAFADWESAARNGLVGQPYTVSDRRLFDTLVRPNMEAFSTALGAVAPPLVTCDNPMFLPSELAAGGGRYLWLVNMTQNDVAGARHSLVPASAKVTLPAGQYVVYNVFTSQLVKERVLNLNLPEGDAVLLALAPAAITGVVLDSPNASAGQIRIKASVQAGKTPLAMTVPIEVELTSPDGAVFCKVWRAAVDGRYEESFHIGSTAASGGWKVRVRDRLSGHTAMAECKVKEQVLPLFTNTAVDCFDADRIAESLQPKHGPILVLYGVESEKAQAEDLAATLRKSGNAVEVATASCYLQRRPRDVIKSVYLSTPLAIDRQVILLGSRQTNPLIKIVVEEFKLSTYLPNLPWPSTGRAVVYWVSGMAGIDNDIVIVCATDKTGLTRGCSKVAVLPAAPTR